MEVERNSNVRTGHGSEKSRREMARDGEDGEGMEFDETMKRVDESRAAGGWRTLVDSCSGKRLGLDSVVEEQRKMMEMR
jgi:hypothetical protein